MVAYTIDGRKWVSGTALDEDPEKWTALVEAAISGNTLSHFNMDGWLLPIENVTAFKAVPETDI